MVRKPTLTFLIVGLCLSAAAQYPANVRTALARTGNNRPELTKALDYFYGTKDSLKIRSINFLVSNMPLHTCYNYYWADEQGQRIPYNELDYTTFNDAVTALDQIRQKKGKIHPVPYSYRDIDSVKADMLIENVNLAAKAYRDRRGVDHVSEKDFLEYVLPYRASIEPIQSWRKIYADKFQGVFRPDESKDAQVSQARKLITEQFSNVYSLEEKNEPLPRIGALQILLRKKGYCEDIADMSVFIARSRGIPAAVDNIPAWATSSGDHFLDFMELNGVGFHFDAVMDSLGREPSKVLRSTYSPQHDAIATWIDTASIPRGFMRLENYKDVTSEYWPVDDITCPLFPNVDQKARVVYASVYNAATWRPIWYGAKKGSSATFKNMSKGVVYLPMSYVNGKLQTAGWPYALGYRNKTVLKPDTVHTRSVTIQQQEKYLKYRPGKNYRLFYWNDRWRQLGEQTAPDGCTQLVFTKVPANALLLLIPEYSQRKERPFIMLDNGERVWW
jgi:hypothetical protein